MKKPEYPIINNSDSEDTINVNKRRYFDELVKWKRDEIYSHVFKISERKINELNYIISQIGVPNLQGSSPDIIHKKHAHDFYRKVELIARDEYRKYLLSRLNWFKIAVSLFLIGVLSLGWECVQVQKEMSLNGRYQINSSDRNFGIDTRTGIIYRIDRVNEIPK
jgi:hypothetical protein